MIGGRMRKDAALLVLVGAMALGFAPTAKAGTYDVVMCNAPGAERQNLSWKVEAYNALGRSAPALSSFRVTALQKCHSEAGVLVHPAMTPKVVRAGDGVGLVFRAPAGNTVKRMQLWRYAATRVTGTTAPDNGWWTAFLRAGSEVAGKAVFGNETCEGKTPTPPETVWCMRGASTFATSPMVAYDDIGEPVVSFALECNGPTPSTRCSTAAAENDPHAAIHLQAAVVTVDDPEAPSVSATLPETYGRQSTPLVLSASDSAGIRSIKLLVDGAERLSEDYECDYRKPAPCPEAVTRAFDLAGVADGRHTVTLVAEDAASNITRSERVVELDGTLPVVDRVTVSGRRVTVDVADGLSGVAGGTIEARRKRDAPFVALKTTLRGGRLVAQVPRSYPKSRLGLRVAVADKAGNALSAVVTSMSLSTRVGRARLRKVRNERATVPYGRAVTVSGRLTTSDNVAMPGQPVVISGAIRRAGAPVEQLATTVTRADGHFAVKLPAGPSRKLTVSYPGAEGFLPRARDVALHVPARSSLHASTTTLRGAGTVRFSGRLGVIGTSLPSGGLRVDLQAYDRGSWRTFASPRARGTRAAWRTSYRFSGVPGRYPIRVRIRREALFPYESGYSASVVVRVR